MRDTSLDLEISRFVNAPRARVWRAWSDPALLVQWWCPKPWTTALRAFDFRAGGAFHTHMRGPEGGVSDNPGVFLEVEPMTRIVWTSVLGAGWRPLEPWLPLTGFFTLADEGAGTRYIARCLHRNPEDAKKHAEMDFYDGWDTCITQLEDLAKSLGD